MDSRDVNNKWELMLKKSKKRLIINGPIKNGLIDCRIQGGKTTPVLKFVDYIFLALKEIEDKFSFDTETGKNIISFEGEYYDNDNSKKVFILNSLQDLKVLPNKAVRYGILDVLIEFGQIDPEKIPSINSFFLHISTTDPREPEFSLLF